MIVIACSWWSIPAGKADTIEGAGTPVADWLASLSRDNYDWATEALDADLGTVTMPEHTSWATPLDDFGDLPTTLDPDDD